MRRMLLPASLAAACLLTGIPVAAQKKPITLESLNAAPAMGAVFASQPIWSPAGGRFLYREGTKVKLYTLAGKERKELFDLSELRKKTRSAGRQPGAPMDWENRRVRESPLQWSADGGACWWPKAATCFSGARRRVKRNSSRLPRNPNRIRSSPPTAAA